MIKLGKIYLDVLNGDRWRIVGKCRSNGLWLAASSRSDEFVNDQGECVSNMGKYPFLALD